MWRRRWAAVCLLAIIGGYGKNRHGFVPVVVRAEASPPPEKLSIPSQILGAKIPVTESNSKQQLWLYEGSLVDPLDGRRVARVKGLELVRPLEDTSNLAIDALLKHPNATYEDSKTVWSQKIFCYTTTKEVPVNQGGATATATTTATATATLPSKEDSPQSIQESILDSVRVRPRSPRKEVPLDQAVAVYETATTFVSRKPNTRRGNAKNDNDEDDKTEILVHSEWPNGQTMWGRAQDCSRQTGKASSSGGSSNSGSVDFTIFAKLRNKNSPLYAPDLIRENDDEGTSRTTKSGDVIVSPKRAALVQFGSASNTMETKHKFGARETYSYRNIPNRDAAATTKKWFSLPWKRSKVNNKESSTNPTLYYTRYGEGPPFYAPGRMCMLELKGRPVNSLSDVGPLLKGLIVGNGESNSNDPPPVANFHWREADGGNEGEPTKGKRRRKMSSKGTINSSNNTNNNHRSPISIQTAWNLRESGSPSQSLAMSPTTSPLVRQRPWSKQQPLALKLVVPDDTTNATMEKAVGIEKWKIRAKRGRKRAVAVWDRIRASTTMETK